MGSKAHPRDCESWFGEGFDGWSPVGWVDSSAVCGEFDHGSYVVGQIRVGDCWGFELFDFFSSYGGEKVVEFCEDVGWFFGWGELGQLGR